MKRTHSLYFLNKIYVGIIEKTLNDIETTTTESGWEHYLLQFLFIKIIL